MNLGDETRITFFLMFLMDSVEFLILRNLLHNEEYIRKGLLLSQITKDITQKIVFEEISSFVEQYNKPEQKKYLNRSREKIRYK